MYVPVVVCPCQAVLDTYLLLLDLHINRKIAPPNQIEARYVYAEYDI